MFEQVAPSSPATDNRRLAIPAWSADAATLASLACAIIAMVSTLQHNFMVASGVIILAVFTDGIDGRLARMFGCTSKVGENLDSLADVVVFGAAPALLVYAFYLEEFPITGTLVAVAFVLAAAFRLAHFHPEPGQPYFSGLPTTATGASLAILPFLGNTFPSLVIAIAVLALGYLMLTTLRFPKVGLLLSPLPKPARWALLAAVPFLYVAHPQLLLVLPVLYISMSLIWNVQLAAKAEPGAFL
jgi:CDP-diacylglycerol---serine O-phosphatidyltransferase